MDDHLIYLDNAATAFPKPPEVLDRMVEAYRRLGASPGRGGYDLAVEAEEVVLEIRQKLARFFGASDPDRMVFASNATDALNLAIQGIVGPGDHVVATRLEHNSVLRPLHHLRERGWIQYDLVPFDAQGFVSPDDVASALRPNTRLAVITHASNVLGTVQPVPEIVRACAERGVPVLLDVAQSAGHVPIDMSGWGVSALAFTGHKGLLGPSGIGGLAVSPALDVHTTRFGGTGIESRQPIHTQTYPHRLEAGTLNLLGILGLSAGLDYLEKAGVDRLQKREMALLSRLWDGLAALPRVKLYGSPPDDRHVPVLTCGVEGIAPADVGAILDGDYQIAVRSGLHCAPLVHADLGTDPRGAVRFSPGCFTTTEDIERVLEAMADLSSKG